MVTSTALMASTLATRMFLAHGSTTTSPPRPSFESQNTCPALWTGADSSLECFERSGSRRRCCSASMCQEHPCCKGRGHQCRACYHHNNRTARRNCPLDNSC